MESNILTETSGNKFKPFNETYRLCAFGLALSYIYPNKYNLRKRWAIFALVIFINLFELFWFFCYTFKCIILMDIFNLTRNMSVGTLVVLFFFKEFYVNFKNDSFDELLKRITDDLLKANDLEEEYQQIYEEYIKKAKFGQTIWVIIPLLLGPEYPMYAAGRMIYENLKSDNGRRYMVHEMDLKFMEDKQYVTPYYEIIFAYNIFQIVTLTPCFIGFDGSFCIATTHLRLKLKLVSYKIQRAFKDAKNRSELKIKLKEGIRDHQEALQIYNLIQNVYGFWLFMVFTLTSFMISLNLYQIYYIHRVDPCITFAFIGVLHIYTPCYYASILIQAGEELTEDLYNTAWEEWAEPDITKSITFMIARSQKHLVLTGNGLCIFNMELFMCIIRASYSFLTLFIR